MGKIKVSAEEIVRMEEDARREKDWKRWGPYLSERQWGTVREDYSPDGSSWDYFPHDHARSRAYRWGEDGLLGITDRQGRMCFAIALWNGKDPILKERLFGLTGLEANHGEDVKECYFYLDSLPTHSYMKALYKYPQSEFPYSQLVTENRRREKKDPEFELLDTGVFDDKRYFDIFTEYAKKSPNDILIRVTVKNHGPEHALLHLLPTLWYRNTWSWGRKGEGYWPKPVIKQKGDGILVTEHDSLGKFIFATGPGSDGKRPRFLFTENETNTLRLFNVPNRIPYVKDAFHEYIIHGRIEAVNPERTGTKAAAHYLIEVPSGGETAVYLRLYAEKEPPEIPFGSSFDEIFQNRIREADEFYHKIIPGDVLEEERRILRQAYAGLLWTKQFYHLSIRDWLEGDPAQPKPPENRMHGRNNDWIHLYNRDVISMPDKWEYPWYAAWDLAFHMVTFAKADPFFAKEQLNLFLREWYMHPNGQIPTYEFSLSDVNPPVHVWSAWRVYKITDPRGHRDRLFLERVFQKLLLNFTWWVNRKDFHGHHVFSGGFLGLDNIGVFDRSQPLPTGGHLEQADGTAWMAFYCATMLSMALELARGDTAYEDMASKFFVHFMAIANAINTLDGSGLWDDKDGFYYDHLHVENQLFPLHVRSLVGLIPLIKESPYVFRVDKGEYRVEYVPGESNTNQFGGNSNWRGPIWFPLNYLIIEALERYHHFYGDTLQVEFPTGSGTLMNLKQVAQQISTRLVNIFIPDENNCRPCHGDIACFAEDSHWHNLVLFHEYFHGETGQGIGASHQTGWTALVIRLIEGLGKKNQSGK